MKEEEEEEEEESYTKYLHKFEKELGKFEDNLKKGFEDNDLSQIDTIRSFAFEKRCILPESFSLLEKANSLLLAHYQNGLNVQIEKWKKELIRT